MLHKILIFLLVLRNRHESVSYHIEIPLFRPNIYILYVQNYQHFSIFIHISKKIRDGAIANPET